MKKQKNVLKTIESIFAVGADAFFGILAIMFVAGCFALGLGILPLEKGTKPVEEINYNPQNDPRIEEMYQWEIRNYEERMLKEQYEKEREESLQRYL